MVENDKDVFLEKEFDFNKAVKNPYAKELKQQVTIQISPAIFEYFASEANEIGIPSQTLIHLYLTDCVKKQKKFEMSWK